MMEGATKRSNFAPEGWHTITPRIVVHDADAFVGFLQQVFDARGEYQHDRPSQIWIGDSLVMVTDVGIRDPSPAFLYVYVPNTDATYRRAIGAGAHAIEEPSDMPYGDRRCMIQDRWGNTWQIATQSAEHGAD